MLLQREYAKVEDNKNIETKAIADCFYFIVSFSKKQKEVWY